MLNVGCHFGGNPVNLTKNSSLDNFPCWTPDGNVGCMSNRDGGVDVNVEAVPP